MAQQPPLPDFFIVGAPKCATTFMSHHLAKHPDVFMPPAEPPLWADKELHYFGSDLVVPEQPRSEAEYLKSFHGANGAERVGEASVLYLYSRQAAREIFEYQPDGRIIAMFRNPVDMLHSYWYERLYHGDETITEFASALDAEADRRQGRRLPKWPNKRHLPLECLFYRDVAAYADQLERFLDVFGAERVHVTLMHDIKASRRGAYKDVLHFLGVDPRHAPEFRRVNAHKRWRSHRAFRLSRHPAVRACMLPYRHRRQYDLALRRINLVHGRRPPVPRAVRKMLVDELTPQIDRMEELLGRDLSAWRQVDPA